MIMIVNPNAPQSMIMRLKDLGHTVISSLLLDSTILTHPDQQIHSLDSTTVITAPLYYQYYREKIPKSISILCGNANPSGTYPKDCAYNVTRVGQFIFCNTNSVDSKLLYWYEQAGYSIIHVNQGYTKCNMVVLTDDCIITEDIGIHNTIIENHLPIASIYVPVGEVSLEGFPYGFIGGSCGGDKNHIFWYGNPEKCSYYAKINYETKKRGIENIFLSKDNLSDLGGIICISL